MAAQPIALQPAGRRTQSGYGDVLPARPMFALGAGARLGARGPDAHSAGRRAPSPRPRRGKGRPRASAPPAAGGPEGGSQAAPALGKRARRGRGPSACGPGDRAEHGGRRSSPRTPQEAARRGFCATGPLARRAPGWVGVTPGPRVSAQPHASLPSCSRPRASSAAFVLAGPWRPSCPRCASPTRGHVPPRLQDPGFRPAATASGPTPVTPGFCASCVGVTSPGTSASRRRHRESAHAHSRTRQCSGPRAPREGQAPTASPPPGSGLAGRSRGRRRMSPCRPVSTADHQSTHENRAVTPSLRCCRVFQESRSPHSSGAAHRPSPARGGAGAANDASVPELPCGAKGCGTAGLARGPRGPTSKSAVPGSVGRPEEKPKRTGCVPSTNQIPPGQATELPSGFPLPSGSPFPPGFFS